jgi:hypothetical protein
MVDEVTDEVERDRVQARPQETMVLHLTLQVPEVFHNSPNPNSLPYKNGRT